MFVWCNNFRAKRVEAEEASLAAADTTRGTTPGSC